MRPVKFRCFTHGKMYDVQELQFNKDGLTFVKIYGVVMRDTPRPGYKRRIQRLPRNECELLPSTGWLDIDNKEVFEGDLVKFPNHDSVYEVKYSKTEGNWGIWYQGINFAKLGMLHFMQVAGNIRENPDL